MYIDEENFLNPKKEFVARYCNCCNEPIYNWETVWIDYSGNWIHEDCKEKDSEQYYRGKFNVKDLNDEWK